jgi:hypothetical protein
VWTSSQTTSRVIAMIRLMSSKVCLNPLVNTSDATPGCSFEFMAENIAVGRRMERTLYHNQFYPYFNPPGTYPSVRSEWLSCVGWACRFCSQMRAPPVRKAMPGMSRRWSTTTPVIVVCSSLSLLLINQPNSWVKSDQHTYSHLVPKRRKIARMASTALKGRTSAAQRSRHPWTYLFNVITTKSPN